MEKKLLKKFYITVNNILYTTILANSIKDILPKNKIKEFALDMFRNGCYIMTIGFEVDHNTNKVDIVYKCGTNEGDNHICALNKFDRNFLEQFIMDLRKEISIL